MSQQRRLIIIGLIVLTIVLGGLTFVISQQLLNSQAPKSSSASTIPLVFEDVVAKNFYNPIYNNLIYSGCYGILSNNTVNAYKLAGFEEVSKYDYSDSTNNDPENKLPLSCTINLDSAKSIKFSIHTFESTSTIPTSMENHINGINKNISVVANNGVAEDSYYTFGSDSIDPTICRMNLFPENNGYEYLEVSYVGFGGKCSDLSKLNGENAYIIAQAVNNIVVDSVTEDTVLENQEVQNNDIQTDNILPDDSIDSFVPPEL